MKKLLLSSLVLAALGSSAAAFAADGSARTSAEWDVTANKDSSHAIEITPKQVNVNIAYDPVAKTLEKKNLDFDIRMMSSDEYSISAYTVKASSTQNELKHTASIATMSFDLNVVDHAGADVALTSTPVALEGLNNFGKFADVAAIAGESKGVSQLVATFSKGKDSTGKAVTEASKLADGQYVGKFDLILDASWKKDLTGTPEVPEE